MPQDLIDDQSTKMQVIAWRRQATGHYLNNDILVCCRLYTLLGLDVEWLTTFWGDLKQ